MNENNTIIFLLSKEPSLRYFAFLAKLILKHTNYQPVFWGSEEHLARLRALGISKAYWINFSTCNAQPIGISSSKKAVVSESSGKKWLRKIRKSIRYHYEKPDLGLIQKVALNVLIILTSRIKSKKIIKQLRPRAICVWGDNAGLVPGDFFRLCNEARIKVIHFPVALSQQEIIAELRIYHKLFLARGDAAHCLAKVVTRYFPDQTLEYKNKLLFYHGLDEILAMIVTGCLTPKPWILGMSRADEALFSTPWEKAYWVERGLSVDKTSVVGFYELDIIRNIASIAAPRKSDFVDNIVYNVPNLAEHNLCSWDKHWEIIEEHLNILKGAGCNLILVLHPKSCLTEYEWLEDKFDCKIHRKTTAEALPFGSLYVSVGSTTALWAASLGIRVFDLSKMCGLDIPVFYNIPRITMISSYDEFRDLLLSSFHNGRRLHEDDWYVDFDARSSYLAHPSVGDALLRHI